MVKLLIIAILAYYVTRYARRLVRAALYEGQPPREVPPRRSPHEAGTRRQPQWNAPPRPPQTPPPDVEDAKWEDIT
ncbi:hypothetical protein [Rhodocaloribacter sp.]